MTFFKQYLVTLTFIVISIWVMPTATVNIKTIEDNCTAMTNTILVAKFNLATSEVSYTETQDYAILSNIANISFAIREQWCSDLVAKIVSKNERQKIGKNVVRLYNAFQTGSQQKTYAKFCNNGVTSGYQAFITNIFTIEA